MDNIIDLKNNLKCKKCGKEFDTPGKREIHEESCEEATNLKPELETLKEEILGENKPVSETPARKIGWGSAIVTIILILLTAFSVVQTVQSATILKKINSGNFGSGSTSAPTTDVQNLPNMVGGC